MHYIIVHIWCTLILGSGGFPRNAQFTDVSVRKEKVQIQKPRGEFEMFLISHQQLNPRQWKRWVPTNVFANWHQIPSFQCLLSWPRPRKTLCLSPKCSVLLGCLPASNRWSLTCSHWPCSCQQMTASTGCPRCTGTAARVSEGRPPFDTPCPFFCQHWEREHLAISQYLRETLTEANECLQGYWGWKGGVMCVILEESLPPGEDTADVH